MNQSCIIAIIWPWIEEGLAKKECERHENIQVMKDMDALDVIKVTVKNIIGLKMISFKS